jgi:hypothetical protein
MTSGEVLVEVGQRPVPFFVVASGGVQALQPSGDTEALFTAPTSSTKNLSCAANRSGSKPGEYS